MSDAMLRLARRAVACKGWRWMCGATARDGGLTAIVTREEAMCEPASVLVVQGDGAGRVVCIGGGSGWLPDLADPATLGCLLALVREAWGDPGVSVWRSNRAEPAVWEVDASGGVSLRGPAFYRTEAEALVAALEAAP